METRLNPFDSLEILRILCFGDVLTALQIMCLFPKELKCKFRSCNDTKFQLLLSKMVQEGLLIKLSEPGLLPAWAITKCGRETWANKEVEEIIRISNQ